MSIFPLPGPAIAFSMYQITLPVSDFKLTTADGGDVKTAYGTRVSIQAVVDPANVKNLEKIFGGSVSGGDIAIWSAEKLYIADMYEVGEDRYQSYATYKGTEHIILQEADWTEQCGLYVYRGSRSVNQGI